MKELKHLEDIFENYDTFVIDLWGVMHNGVVLNPKAIEAVDQLKKKLTNFSCSLYIIITAAFIYRLNSSSNFLLNTKF